MGCRTLHFSWTHHFAKTGGGGGLSNFENLYSKIKTENPFAIFFTGDFNAHSQLWWSDGDTTPEGTKIDELFTYPN